MLLISYLNWKRGENKFVIHIRDGTDYELSSTLEYIYITASSWNIFKGKVYLSSYKFLENNLWPEVCLLWWYYNDLDRLNFGDFSNESKSYVDLSIVESISFWKNKYTTFQMTVFVGKDCLNETLKISRLIFYTSWSQLTTV